MKTIPSLLFFALVFGICQSALAREPAAPINFRIEIDGIAVNAFTEASGLTIDVEVIEFQDGDDLVLRKRPGRTKYSNIVLKRGYVSDPNDEVRDWFKNIQQGQADRRSIAITLEDDRGNTLSTWNLVGCWPKQWKVNGFDGKGNDVLTEEITFVVEQISID